MNPTHREPRGTAGYTERHVFLSSSRSPHAPFHSLALPLPPRPSSPFASLSLFFEFVKFFGVAITENFFLFFGKIWVEWKWTKNLSPSFGRYGFGERAIQYSYYSRIYLFWIQFGYRSSIRVWIFRRNLLKFEIFRFFKIEIIIMDRSIYIIVSNINVFESYTFWGFI